MPRRTGHLTLVAVGKLRERHWQVAQAEYIRRLENYTDFKLVEVRDMVGKSLPDAVGMLREGEGLLVAAHGKRTILLSPDGRRLTSPELAQYLHAQFELYGDLAFLIGGPLGFDDAVYAAAHDRLALSSLTFPHELARIMTLEQLYRAFTIIHGEPYHK